MERNIMMQWMNLHWNNSFANWMQLPLLYEKSGVVLLVLVGLMAASPAGTPAVRRNTDGFGNFKILYRLHW